MQTMGVHRGWQRGPLIGFPKSMFLGYFQGFGQLLRILRVIFRVFAPLPLENPLFLENILL